MARLQRPFVVGLTGGIGSGKSTVADLFAARGVPVIDTDVISREVVAPGSETLNQIVQHFGSGMLQADGSLDRTLLRRRIFEDDAARQWLEALLHPLIRARVLERVTDCDASWLVLAVPLLLETDAYDFIDRVLVVDAAAEIRTLRVRARDGSKDATIAAIIARQLPDAERRARADDVIDNSGPLSALPPQVAALAARYEELANDRNTTG